MTEKQKRHLIDFRNTLTRENEDAYHFKKGIEGDITTLVNCRVMELVDILLEDGEDPNPGRHTVC